MSIAGHHVTRIGRHGHVLRQGLPLIVLTPYPANLRGYISQMKGGYFQSDQLWSCYQASQAGPGFGLPCKKRAEGHVVGGCGRLLVPVVV